MLKTLRDLSFNELVHNVLVDGVIKLEEVEDHEKRLYCPFHQRDEVGFDS